MKRTVSTVVLCALLLIPLAACGMSDDGAATDSGNTTEEPADGADDSAVDPESPTDDAEDLDSSTSD